MEGLSPWELATLKVVFHRCDRSHKGFLDAEDVKHMTRALGVSLTAEEATRLFSTMDTDNDGRISFSELMSHLTNNEGHVADMQLRAAMLDTSAIVATGAAIPLILKGKTMIVIGSVMFTDPIRLFRDFYVDYATAIKSPKWAFAQRKEKVLNFVDGLKVGIRSGRTLRAAALVIFAIAVDCAVGACVFYLYTKVRRKFQREYQAHLQKQQQQQAKAVADGGDSGSNKGGGGGGRVGVKMTRGEITALEALAGGCAGVFAGILQPIAKRAVAWELHWPTAGFSRNALLRIRHQAAAHAAFFSGFYFARTEISHVLFDTVGFKRSTTNDAVVTTLAGCCAGGCWQIAQQPLKQGDTWIREHGGVQQWRKLPLRERYAIRTAGLARSLLTTMPLTGVAFMFYEASFTLFA